jgi:UDP-N-acetyl-D-galactosamine dehydrogenase
MYITDTKIRILFLGLGSIGICPSEQQTPLLTKHRKIAGSQVKSTAIQSIRTVMTDQIARKIAIIGLGYVGLPVACAFARHAKVLGFDKKTSRIQELKSGIDHTGEAKPEDLNNPNLAFSDDENDLDNADFFIIAVPTPVNSSKNPDLSILLNASQMVGTHLKPGDIVVYESTVYPGATEHDCVPVLEQASGLICGQDFKVGYSPERINPGDQQHRLETITKVVAGQDAETLDIIATVYEKIIDAGVHRAPSIKAAEAAKVIENTQRDLNIALMNELALIFDKLGIDTHDVIEAAATKWNFLPFKPGLVGGHCIGVDPYYLTHQAQRHGYQPQVILAGRRINDNMGQYVAQQTIKHLIQADCTVKGARVAILGMTFKENCPDIRNSKVIDIIHELQSYGITCLAHGARANKAAVKREYDIDLVEWDALSDLNAMVLAVPHDEYKEFDAPTLKTKFNSQPIMIDVKSVLNRNEYRDAGFTVWRL